MRLCGFVQTLPPVMICLAPEASLHGLNDVARISMDGHPTRFLQRFQTECSGGDFSLLVRGLPEISSERAPESFEPEQRHGCSARDIAAVAEARAVTKDGDEFGWPWFTAGLHRFSL